MGGEGRLPRRLCRHVSSLSDRPATATACAGGGRGRSRGKQREWERRIGTRRAASRIPPHAPTIIIGCTHTSLGRARSGGFQRPDLGRLAIPNPSRPRRLSTGPFCIGRLASLRLWRSSAIQGPPPLGCDRPGRVDFRRTAWEFLHQHPALRGSAFWSSSVAMATFESGCRLRQAPVCESVGRGANSAVSVLVSRRLHVSP